MASDFELFTELVREQVGDETIAWGVFRIADSRKDSPRRVVWVPVEFRCETGAAFQRHSDAESLGDTLIVDRTIVECMISGVDFEDACLIRRQVLNACKLAMGTSSIPIDGGYITEQDGQSGYSWGGAAKIVQRFEWLINVPRLVAGGPLDGSGYDVVVEQIDQTGELQTDDTSATDETFSIV